MKEGSAGSMELGGKAEQEAIQHIDLLSIKLFILTDTMYFLV